MATDTKLPRNADGYKPNVIPQALKAIEGSRAEMRLSSRTETANLDNPTGKGREPMNDQTAVNINGASYVMAVKNLEQTVHFYSGLGFKHEVIGSKVKHHHVSRGKLTFILVEAKEADEFTPISSRYPEQYFDVFVYINAVDLLAEEVRNKT